VVQLQDLLSGLPSAGVLVLEVFVTARPSDGDSVVATGTRSGKTLNTGWVSRANFADNPWRVLDGGGEVVITGLVRWRAY